MVPRRASLRLPLFCGLLAVCLVPLHPADATTGYVIYTKDGSRIEALEKPTVSGKMLKFLSKLGASQSIALDIVDKERTEKANQDGLGGIYVLDTPDQKVIPPPVNKTPSLSQYIREHKKSELGAEATTSRPVESPQGGPQVKFSKGGPAETPLTLDPQTNDVFMRAFDQASLRGARLTPIPAGVRVQAVTETEQQIFWALSAVAKGLKESRAYGRPVDKVDLWMVTSSGDPAGHFTMSAEDADALLNNRITPAKYFVANVIFQ
jgi:hypothetical protein